MAPRSVQLGAQKFDVEEITEAVLRDLATEVS